MNARYFDVIVLGENLAGLIAAALLAARKYSVLLVRQVAGPGKYTFIGSAERRSRLITPSILDNPIPAAVVRELNLGHKIRSIFKAASPLFQILDDEHRPAVYADRAKLTSELVQEFGKDILPDDVGELLTCLEEVNAIFDKLLVPGLSFQPDAIKERWQLKNRVKEFKKTINDARTVVWKLDGLWRESILGRMMQSVQIVTSDAREGFDDLFAFRRAISIFGGLLHPLTDEGFEDLFFERIDKRNGKIVDLGTFQEIEYRRDGFVFNDAKQTYGARSVVAALDYFMLPEIFQYKKAEKFVREQLRRVKPASTWIKVSFLLEHDALPEGMGQTLFYRDPGGSEAPLFYRRDFNAPEDAELERLEVFQLIPVEQYNAIDLKSIQNRLIERVRELVPFMQSHLKKVYLEEAPKNPGGTLTPLAGRRLVYNGSGGRELFRGVPYTLPFKHSYLAGPEVLPELGLEGEFITGWTIAQKICNKRPKKNELR